MEEAVYACNYASLTAPKNFNIPSVHVTLMQDLSPNITELFTIPFSFFIVILSILVIQSIAISIVSRHLGNISFKHPALFRAMSWWGVFVHELSHAITALLTFSKIKEFKVSSSGGHVMHYSSSSGFFQWLAAQLISASPAFIPPIIVAILLKYLDYIEFQGIIFNFMPSEPEPIAIISNLYLGLIPYIVKTVGILLISLDYSKVQNVLMLLILTFSFSSEYLHPFRGKDAVEVIDRAHHYLAWLRLQFTFMSLCK